MTTGRRQAAAVGGALLAVVASIAGLMNLTAPNADLQVLVSDFCQRHPEHRRCASPVPSGVTTPKPSASATPRPSPTASPQPTPSPTVEASPAGTPRPTMPSSGCASYADALNAKRDPDVVINAAACAAAVTRAKDLATRDELVHDLGPLKAELAAAGVCWQYIGEVILYNRAAPTYTVDLDQWWGSAAHHDVLVNPRYDTIGGAWDWTAVSGRRYAVIYLVDSCATGPTPSPVPSATPTPTPTVPPTASCTVTLASGASIQSTVNAVSNGATICLTPGGSYTAASAVTIASRQGITIDGRGAALSSAGYHPAFTVRASTGITIRDLRITGSHPQPGVYVAGQEHAHGVSIEGSDRTTLERLAIDRMQGDGVYVAHWGTHASTGVTMADLTITANGRMGIAVVAGRDVTAVRTTFRDIAYSLIDCEPDTITSGTVQGCWNLLFDGGTSTGWVGRFTDGSVGTSAFYVGTPHADGTSGIVIDGVTIRGFTVRDARFGIWTTVSPSNYRARNVVFEGNSSPVAWWGPAGGVAVCNRTDGFTFRGNSQPVTAGHGMYAAALNGCTATVTGNTGANLSGQVRP